MTFYINTDQKVILRYQAKLEQSDPVAEAARTFKNKDILMAAWRTGCQDAGIAELSLKTIIGQDIQTVATKSQIDEALQVSGSDPTKMAEFDAGAGTAGQQQAFTILTTGIVQGNDVTKMLQTYASELSNLKITKVNVWSPS